MPFPFSFKFTPSGTANPFSDGSSHRSRAETSKSADKPAMHGTANAPSSTPRRPVSPCLAPPQPLAKKRGWVPSSSEISVPAAVETSTNGYLDTPARYREMAQNADDGIEEMVADLPPPKRRKTLAGSIVSTAMSAALIGTAVGLTVYRLWRNRGKHPEILPPPPYEQGEWIHPSEEPQDDTLTTHVTPPTPQQKSRKRHERRHSAAKRPLARPRKLQQRISPAHSLTTFAVPPPPISQPSLESNFGFPDVPSTPEAVEEEADEPEIDDQMDWIGGQLSMLIAEGRRALGTEVVVMSESKEDEIDDGLGKWVDEDNRMTASTSGSLRGRRKARPSNVGIMSPPPSYMSPPATPRRNHRDASHSRQSSSIALPLPSSPGRTSRRQSVSSARSYVDTLHREEPEDLDSPDLREAMKRAREAYLLRKSQAAAS